MTIIERGANSNRGEAERLQGLAKQHLMLHFTDMSAYAEEDVPIIARGEGCHVYDVEGNRYIDGLSGLYCVNLGHSHGDEIGAAAHEQMRTLPFSSNWTVAHPPGIELAAKLAELSPPGLDRTFFASGGAESVESAWKLALQWHQANGEPQRRKAIARRDAYHGVTLGALALTGLEECQTPFEPLAIPTTHVANTNAYRHPEGEDEARLTAALLAELEAAIVAEGPDTVAMLIAEPVQNAGGCIVPPAGYWQGLREICDRHGILLCSDDVICAFGRIGHWFGADRFGYVPDLITFAKGLTGSHFPMGGVLISDRVAAPFLDGRADYLHGFTFGGHPVGAAVALASIRVMEEHGVLENVRANEPLARAGLDSLREIPIVGDVRGLGHFWAIELVRDQATKEPFEGPAAEWLLKDVLSTELWSRGLICRLDDRAEPIVQIAPPLVADAALIEEIVAILRAALTVAAERMGERPELTSPGQAGARGVAATHRAGSAAGGR
ncbi:MAG TPA: aspartate aminotransferase family protein [Solirubrobacterales bacterium]|jgi:adenosylmethionine-8-amino-7-oxononanoate aminotransferase